MTDIDALVARLNRKVRSMPVVGSAGTGATPNVIHDDGMRLVNPDGPDAITALTTERAKVAALEAEVKIAEAKGWRDAVTCVQYSKANWSQDCRSEAERKALEDAARELVNELVTCSPGEWLGTEWKTAQDYSAAITKLEADATRWREVAGELAGAIEAYQNATPRYDWFRDLDDALARFKQENGQ